MCQIAKFHLHFERSEVKHQIVIMRKVSISDEDSSPRGAPRTCDLDVMKGRDLSFNVVNELFGGHVRISFGAPAT